MVKKFGVRKSQEPYCSYIENHTSYILYINQIVTIDKKNII